LNNLGIQFTGSLMGYGCVNLAAIWLGRDKDGAPEYHLGTGGYDWWNNGILVWDSVAPKLKWGRRLVLGKDHATVSAPLTLSDLGGPWAGGSAGLYSVGKNNAKKLVTKASFSTQTSRDLRDISIVIDTMVEGKGLVTFKLPKGRRLAPGTYAIRWDVRDIAGNVSKGSKKVTL
jgi:hypothetical protein